MMSPSAIRNKTEGKRIRGRFRSITAHVEQERPELCRIGNRKGLKKSDDGCCSQRRSAIKRSNDSVCQRIGFIRDSEASRRHTDRSLTRKTAKITDIPARGPVVRNHNSLKMADEYIQCSTENYVRIVVPGLSTGCSSSATSTSPTSVPQDAVIPTLCPETTRSESTNSQAQGDPSDEPAETKNTNKNEDNERVR